METTKLKRGKIKVPQKGHFNSSLNQNHAKNVLRFYVKNNFMVIMYYKKGLLRQLKKNNSRSHNAD